MQARRLTTAAARILAVVLLAQRPGAAQELHVDPRWKECSFRLDSSLTQSAWHQFTREVGLAIYSP